MGGAESPAPFSTLNHRRFYTLLAVAKDRVRTQLFCRSPILQRGKSSFSALNRRRFYTLLAFAKVRVQTQLISRSPILQRGESPFALSCTCEHSIISYAFKHLKRK